MFLNNDAWTHFLSLDYSEKKSLKDDDEEIADGLEDNKMILMQMSGHCEQWFISAMSRM